MRKPNAKYVELYENGNRDTESHNHNDARSVVTSTSVSTSASRRRSVDRAIAPHIVCHVAKPCIIKSALCTSDHKIVAGLAC